MQGEDKKYGAYHLAPVSNSRRFLIRVAAFTLSMLEYIKTIRTLWPNVKGTVLFFALLLILNPTIVAFMKDNPELISPDNAMDMLLDRTGEYYNRCHCASPAWLVSSATFQTPGYSSLEQLRNRRHGSVARGCLHAVLRVPRLQRGMSSQILL
jgi:hypothetical protein